MKVSIQTRLLAMCIVLVLLTTAGLSATYYVLTKQDKHRESRQRIQIAFDIILDDFAVRLKSYTKRFDEFLKENTILSKATYAYSQDTSRINSSPFLITDLSKVSEELKKFGHLVSVDRLTLYGTDRRLLAVYQGHDE